MPVLRPRKAVVTDSQEAGQDTSRGPGVFLRELRQQRNATLKDFSVLTGLPISTLSKLENGKLGMTYEKLVRLSRSLQVDLTELIKQEPKAHRAGPTLALGRREITRAGEGPVVSTVVYRYQYPAADLVEKSLNPMIIEVTAKSIDEFGELMRHPGEEYAIVLEGAVEFHSDIYKPARLEKGDSIYFDANMGHAYVAALSTPCRVLSVCSASDEALRESRPALKKADGRLDHPKGKASANLRRK